VFRVNTHEVGHLLTWQVQKYRIDEVYDSKLKAKNWDLLIEEFHALTENRVTISKPQIIRHFLKIFIYINIFGPMPLLIFFTAQTMHIKSKIHNSIAMFFLKTFNPGGIRTRVRCL
jgi:hypothetical protein